MLLRTVEQVRRIFRIVAGFTLLLAGVVMLVTPACVVVPADMVGAPEVVPPE